LAQRLGGGPSVTLGQQGVRKEENLQKARFQIRGGCYIDESMVVLVSLLAACVLLSLVFFWPRGAAEGAAPARGGMPKGGRPQDARRSAKSPFDNVGKIAKLNDDEDDLEITLVTASPMYNFSAQLDADAASAADKAPAPPAFDLSKVPRAPKPHNGETEVEPSIESSTSPGPRVEVIYETEAEGEEVTSPIARILVSAHGDSDCGRKRPRNEDSLLIFPERSVFAVADGMGGYEGGHVASALAVETIRGAFETQAFDGKIDSDTSVPRRGRELACALQMANQAILQKARTSSALSQMGTTIVSARFSPNKQRVYIGHVGDSRCYRLRGNSFRQLTTDHTMKQLGMKGPGSNELFRAVGIKPEITIDLIVDKPRADDIYLLCSDGLSKMVSDQQIADILLGEADLEAAVYGLIEAANDRGGKDNITTILVKVVDRMPFQAAS
jgi:protein phosphatase